MRKTLLLWLVLSWNPVLLAASASNDPAKGLPDLAAVKVFLGDTSSIVTTNEITNVIEREEYWLWFVWDAATSEDIRYQVKALIRDRNTGSTLEGCTDVITTGSGRFELRCPLWRAQEGNFRLLGEVDSRGEIDESDETNNLLQVDFEVGPRGGGPQCLSAAGKAVSGNPDGFEPDDVIGQARAISIGEFENEDFRYPQRHNFHQIDDYDWVKFHTEFDPGRGDFLTYIVQVLRPGFSADVAMELYDAAGELQTDFGDDGIWDFNGAGEEETAPPWKPDSESIYYLCARQSDGSVSGVATEYDLDISIIEPDGGRIAGRVTDVETSLGVELALLRTNPSTSFRWSTVDGEYAMVNLGPGFYDLQVDALGYNSRVINNIEVVVGKETPVDIALSPLDDSGYQITGAQSGSYFDPGHNGEGWLLEILSLPTAKLDGSKMPGVALAYWFTFPAPGLVKGGEEEQAWLVGVGEIVNDVITFRNVVRPQSGIFGPSFDPSAVERPIWGDFEFRFTGCNAGTMTYIGPPGWDADSLELQRITRLAGLECGDGKGNPSQEVKVGAIAAGMSGSWFDPAHDGEGWLIEVLDENVALVYWFSYDTSGNQAWWVGVGSIDGKTITVDDARLPVGAVFGPGFDAGDVTLEPWGTMVFSFESCDAGTMSYDSANAEFGSGMLTLKRITSIAGLPCS